MSGGSFNYAYIQVNVFADELSDRLDTEPMGREARQRLRRLVIEARQLAALMRATEWFFSGDHGEETFLTLVDKIDAETGT